MNGSYYVILGQILSFFEKCLLNIKYTLAILDYVWQVSTCCDHPGGHKVQISKITQNEQYFHVIHIINISSKVKKDPCYKTRGREDWDKHEGKKR